MREELVEYIEKKIFPMYERNEEGHGISHIKTVIERSLKLAKDYDVDIDMVYTIAAYHDLGHHIDRKKHEIISAQIFMQDEKMRKYFSQDQRETIKEAIEDHRASSNHIPRTIYGKIVSTADRTIMDIDTTIRRAYSYGKKHEPELTEEQQIERVYEHLKKKYGENGYAKVWIKDEEFEKSSDKLRQELKDKEEFMKRIQRVAQNEEKRV